MKRTLFILVAICSWVFDMFASDCYIPICPLVKHTTMQDGSPEVDNYIVNRLRVLTSNSGNLGAIENTQFAVVFEYDIIYKQIIDGVPTKFVYSVSATFSIMDLKSQNVYGTLNKQWKGIGNNEQKALLNAFSKMSNSDRHLQDFIIHGKEQIVEYYNKNYPSIISKANSLASLKRYDEAIYTLLMIPECCVGYESSVKSMSDIYQQFVNQHCNENLAQARAAWIASPNRDGAISASIFLSEIYPDASCYDDAMELAGEIRKQMGEEWKFEMKRWDDSVSLEQQRINAMRSIGIAYAKSTMPQRLSVPNK